MASKKMEEVLEFCKRDSLDKRRLAEFWPKNLPEIKDLPIYSLKEIDKLTEMIEGECEGDLQSQRWFTPLRGIHSCASFFERLDGNHIGVDIVELLLAPFDEMPLLVNTMEPRLNLFVRWRLEIGK